MRLLQSYEYHIESLGVLYEGDCLDIMAKMEPESVDTVLTDPPYGLEFMGKDWDHGIPGVHFRTEALRVAKPGAILMAFGGTRTFHRLTCAIEDAGWQIRDCLMWLYGQGFPKSLDISKAIDKGAGAERRITEERPIAYSDSDCWGTPNKNGIDNDKSLFNVGAVNEGGTRTITAPATPAAQLWNGWGTGLKPAWEPIILAMKPLDGTFAHNALEHGVAGLHIDGGRIPTKDKITTTWSHKTPQEGWDRPWRHDPEAAERIYRRKLAGTEKAMSQGRYPSNLILDSESAAALDEQTGILNSGANPEKRVPHIPNAKFTGFLGQEDANPQRGANSGGASRFFYCAKASRAERGTDNKHPTVKPLKLMGYLCKLTATPMGGIILDPFAGSGTTGLAAKQTGRKFVLIENDPESCRIAKNRLQPEGELKLVSSG